MEIWFTTLAWIILISFMLFKALTDFDEFMDYILVLIIGIPIIFIVGWIGYSLGI